MEIKEKIMSYCATIEGYDYNEIEYNADYIFENAIVYNKKILAIIPNEDKYFFKDIFKSSLYYINKNNIDVMLNFFKNEMKHERHIEIDMLGILKSNRNLTLSQLKEVCAIENYYKSPGPSKLKYELSIIQDCSEEFIANNGSVYIKC